MTARLILASGSQIRTQLLQNAGLAHVVQPARIDEDAVQHAMAHAKEPPRNIADALADAKAAKISARNPGAVVIGSDQLLSLGDRIFQKPSDESDLAEHLMALQGQTHTLWSAAVVYLDGEPQWRHVGRVDMTMRPRSTNQVAAYIDANWDDIRHCVGGYRYEAEGIRLFTRVEGDYFHILGIPLRELVDYCMTRGLIS